MFGDGKQQCIRIWFGVLVWLVGLYMPMCYPGDKKTRRVCIEQEEGTIEFTFDREEDRNATSQEQLNKLARHLFSDAWAELLRCEDERSIQAVKSRENFAPGRYFYRYKKDAGVGVINCLRKKEFTVACMLARLGATLSKGVKGDASYWALESGFPYELLVQASKGVHFVYVEEEKGSRKTQEKDSNVFYVWPTFSVGTSSVACLPAEKIKEFLESPYRGTIIDIVSQQPLFLMNLWLYRDVLRGHKTMIKYLGSKQNLDLDICHDQYHNRTMLMDALIYKNFAAARFLCRHGASLTAVDGTGKSVGEYARDARFDLAPYTVKQAAVSSALQCAWCSNGIHGQRQGHIQASSCAPVVEKSYSVWTQEIRALIRQGQVEGLKESLNTLSAAHATWAKQIAESAVSGLIRTGNKDLLVVFLQSKIVAPDKVWYDNLRASKPGENRRALFQVFKPFTNNSEVLSESLIAAAFDRDDTPYALDLMLADPLTDELYAKAQRRGFTQARLLIDAFIAHDRAQGNVERAERYSTWLAAEQKKQHECHQAPAFVPPSSLVPQKKHTPSLARARTNSSTINALNAQQYGQKQRNSQRKIKQRKPSSSQRKMPRSRVHNEGVSEGALVVKRRDVNTTLPTFSAAEYYGMQYLNQLIITRQQQDGDSMLLLQKPAKDILLAQDMRKNNSQKTPSEEGGTSIAIDWPHIFTGNERRLGGWSGLHHDADHRLQRAHITVPRSLPDIHGVYHACVAGTLKTFFPAHWSKQQVASYIRKALFCIAQRGASLTELISGQQGVTGYKLTTSLAHRGGSMSLEFIMPSTLDRVATCYPLYETNNVWHVRVKYAA